MPKQKQQLQEKYDKVMLESEKIALTKQYEKLQEEINYYWLDQIAYDAWPFKELINRREACKRRINEIKNMLDNIDKQTLSL